MSDLNGQVIWINMDDIEPPDFPRDYTPEEIDDLAADIVKNHQLEAGMVEPNAVNSEQLAVKSEQGEPKTDDSSQLAARSSRPWKLIFGWHRYLAIKQLGWKQMKNEVREGLTPLQRLQIISSENSKRVGVSPFYQAELIYKMQTELRLEKPDATQKELAKAAGMTEADLSDYLSIDTFPPDLKAEFRRLNFNLSQLREIIRTDNTDQLRIVSEKAIKKELSSRDIRAEVERQKKRSMGTVPTDASQSPVGTVPTGVSELTLKVSQKKGRLKIIASFPRSDDMQPVFSKIIAETQKWCAQHPNAGRKKKQEPSEILKVLGN